MSWQTTVPLLLILLAGLPHGATDGVIAQYFAAKRLLSFTLFIILYTTIAALTFIIWYLAPFAGLVIIAALSIIHFGMMDTSESAHLPYRAIRIFAHGVMPILVIATAHSKETAELFLILIHDDASELIDLLKITTPIWALIIFWLFLFQGVLGRRAAVEIGILTIILTLFPPLWGFAFYFCGIHSLRHFREVIRIFQPLKKQFYWIIFAISIFSIAFVLAMAYWLTSANFDKSLIRVTFIGLAALTTPHILLIDCFKALHRVKKYREPTSQDLAH
tara:strand:- start:273 stop:1100 length:828 start_codon:yes stop_codon:yes gene_type:complete